jgi:hypothetical protein
MQVFNTFVRIVVAAILILTVLPGRVTAQQNHTAALAPASSAVPQIIQFSGQLNKTSGGGAALVPSGTVSIMFTLYENEQGGTALWSETQNVQVDAQGHYTALLGSTSPEGLPFSLFTTGQAHWLAVQPLLQGFDEQPRVLLVSAPYALKAGDAETVGGLPPSAFVRANASPGTSGTSAVNTTASTGSAPANTAPPAVPCTNVTPFCNPTTGYKIEGKIVLVEPGGFSSGNIALGYQALYSNTTGGGNTASGVNALFSNNTGSNNTASGYQALLSDTTGNFNTASGYQALYSNTIGSTNTTNGYQALINNTTGSNNTASGFQALYRNTTASTNTASGFQALYSNTTGSNNTASGYQALINNTIGGTNTASGYQALYRNTTGSTNTASGASALINNTTGTYNTASGVNALFSNTTGGTNTASGYQALYSNTIGGNNTASGYNACVEVVAGNNVICIGAVSGPTHDIPGPATYIAGIYGATVGSTNSEVCIDNTGLLGTANCPTNAQPSAQQEAIKHQQQQIQTLQMQNEEFQQRLSRLESLIAKKLR